MILESLVPVLRQAGIAEPIMINHMPHRVRIGVLLLNKLAGAEIDHEIDGLRRSSFQAIVRHPEYAQGRQLAERVMDALQMARREIPGAEVKYIRARHEPVVYPISEGELLEFSVNFDAVYGRM